jgi:hypothetical protein
MAPRPNLGPRVRYAFVWLGVSSAPAFALRAHAVRIPHRAECPGPASAAGLLRAMCPAAQAPGPLGICRLIICTAGCRHQQALGREASGPSPKTKNTAQSLPHPFSCNVRLSFPPSPKAFAVEHQPAAICPLRMRGHFAEPVTRAVRERRLLSGPLQLLWSLRINESLLLGNLGISSTRTRRVGMVQADPSLSKSRHINSREKVDLLLPNSQVT